MTTFMGKQGSNEECNGGRENKNETFCSVFPPEPGTEMKLYLQTATENTQSRHCCAGRLEKKKYRDNNIITIKITK